jgi:hypothetical protein
MRISLSVAALAVAAFSGAAAQAHHSFAAEFSYELSGTIEGEVVEVLFVNPHARYFVAVTDEDGNEVVWDAQTRSTSALTRAGWTKDTIRVGDKLTLEGNLGRNDTRKIWIREVRLASGDVIRPVPTEDEK